MDDASRGQPVAGPLARIPFLPRAHLAVRDRVAAGHTAAYLSVEDIRRIQQLEPRLTAASRRLARLHALPPSRLEVVDATFDASHGPVPLRRWRRREARSSGNGGEASSPVVLVVHGGGFAFGSPARMDWVARRLALGTGATVVSAGYRLAPDHPHPAALDDVDAVLAALLTPGHEIGELVGHVDSSRVATYGESAGGLLTALAGIRRRDAAAGDSAIEAVRAQVLVYPATDLTVDRGPDAVPLPVGPRLSQADLERFVTLLLAGVGEDGLGRGPVVTDARLASPAHAEDLGGLPHTLLQTADHDPLEPDGLRFAERLRADGTPVVVTRYPGTAHGFLSTPTIARQAGVSVGEAVRFLNRHL